MNDREHKMPGMFAGLIAVARRDLLLAWKRPGDVLNPLFFFAMVCTLFPLAVGPSAEQLTFSPRDCRRQIHDRRRRSDRSRSDPPGPDDRHRNAQRRLVEMAPVPPVSVFA